MAIDITWDTQYNPVSTSETSTNDALSARALTDLTLAINNWNYCIGNFKVIMDVFTDEGGESQRLACSYSGGGDTSDEYLITQFAPIRRREIYDSFNFIVGHYRSAGAGTVTWKFYILQEAYNAEDIYINLSSYTVNKSVSFTTSTDAHAISCVNITDVNFGDMNTPVYLILSGSASASGTIAKITTIDVKPMLSERL